ncbi:MAG: Lrp/AsnC family transcriptional regulator [Hyphomicrobiales bacterium]
MHYKGRALDEIDAEIIDALIENARISMRDLAELVGMSAPGIKDRLRRLEDIGAIGGYTVKLDPKNMGYALQAIVQVKPLPGQLHRVEKIIQDMPECTECDKVTGEDCFIVRLCLRSIDDLDPLLAPLSDRAETNSSIVKATTVVRRNPPLTIK